METVEQRAERRIKVAIGDLVIQLQHAQAVIEHLQERVKELEKPASAPAQDA